MQYTITNHGKDVPRHSQRTATADTLPAAFEAAGSLAETFACDVLISDPDGPVARITWVQE